MTEEFLWMWAKFSFAATGTLLPLNYIDMDEEATITMIGHTVADEDDPITCRNGKVVRQLALYVPYDKKEVLWN